MRYRLVFYLLLFLINCVAQKTNLRAGNWSDKTAWSGNTLPGINDTVSLKFDITIDMNADCRLLIANGHKVNIYTGVNLNVLGNSAPPDSTFTDPRDGQVYRFKTIGTQVWMTQNLNYDVPNSFCFDNNPDKCKTYGRLYDWSTALTVAPPGWHLPSSKEWQTLIDYLGSNFVAGDKMKEAGYAHWEYYNYISNRNGVATNSSGFSALPGGYHNNTDGLFYSIGITCRFWSSTSLIQSGAWACIMQNDNPTVSVADGLGMGKGYALSVRCIRD